MANQVDENRRPHSPWEEYYLNGELIEIYSTTSGKLRLRGKYKKGLRCGLWEEYSDVDGNTLLKGEWKPIGNNLVKRRGLFFEFRHNK